MKTLGVLWLAKEEIFTYRVNLPDKKFQLTKRNFLCKKDVQVNDVVLVVATDTLCGQWPLGRVEAVCPGKDKHIRVVKVRVGRKELLRLITRICPLELLTEDDTEE